VRHLALVDPGAADRAARELDGVVVLCGEGGVEDVIAASGADLVLNAIVGSAGLRATLAAFAAGADVALANKESLVAGGELVLAAAHASGRLLLPVDSEHSALAQCLDGAEPGAVTGLVITASGGPFRGRRRDQLGEVTASDALAHPTWSMGQKITIDSATLMNKGLEVIEARWLFDIPADRIEVVVHPQSIVHSMVELTDGSTIAQLGVTDMRLPIQYAFSYPDRWPSSLPALDFARLGPLEFLAPDLDRFPCLRLAYDALRAGGTAAVVLNAANEVSVEAFLGGRLPFPGIARVIEDTLTAHDVHDAQTLGEVRAADRWARARAKMLVGGVKLKA
jgi:1-deoxy-D-xylulose-5-phosphate reductoisomerase